MKKVKIMLISLAVLALIGGVLAFKMPKGFSTYCTILAQHDLNPPPGKPAFYCPTDSRWVGSKVCSDLDNVTTVANANESTSNVCTTTMNNIACAQQDCHTLTTVYQGN